MKSPVLAFLQNCWFRPGTPDVIIQRYQSDQSYRRKVLANCMTGRRLRRAFGAHYDQIWWENASNYVSNVPSGKAPANSSHMHDVILDVKPKVVITFGQIAYQGMYDMAQPAHDCRWAHFPHPNSRGLRQSQLDEFATKIIELYF